MTNLLDRALDRSVVLGFSKVGSALRRRWWPADPEPGVLAGKRVLVTGASSGSSRKTPRSCCTTVCTDGRRRLGSRSRQASMIGRKTSGTTSG